jgi:uncharacterized Zn finger protein (UPF0148 family)
MANCPKCGKELEEGITNCPTCDVEENVVSNTIEEVQVDPTSVISLDDNKEKTTSSLEEQKQEEQIITIEETNETPDETNITNDGLETVSVDVTNISLEAEPAQKVVIETPEMPEPTIGELNPELLGSAYDEAERINNEKIEAKRQQELAELERKRQEEEARRQAQAQAGRPDLLAGINNGEINIETMPKKKKTSKILIFFLIILILLAIAGGLYYFFVLKNN